MKEDTTQRQTALQGAFHGNTAVTATIVRKDHFDLANQLHAGFYARHAGLEILNTHTRSGELGKELAKSGTIVRKLEHWKNQFLESDSAPMARLPGSDTILRLLANLTQEINNLAESLQRLCAKGWNDLTPVDVATLASGYVRQAYRDHARHESALIQAARIGGQEKLDELAAGGPDVERSYTTARELITRLERTGDWTIFERMQLVALCLSIPSEFRLRVVELRLLRGQVQGRSPAESLGLGAFDNSEWRKAGFDLLQAASWIANRLNIQVAIQWRDAGLNQPRTAADWLSRSIPLEEALAWMKQGTSPKNATLWRMLDVTDPVLAGELMGIPDGFRLARDWHEAGLSCSHLPAWTRAGVTDPLLIRPWAEAGHAEALAAAPWIKAGISSPAEMEQWRSLGERPQTAAAWKAINLNPSSVPAWLRSGVSEPREAREWVRRGVRDLKVVAWLGKRFERVFETNGSFAGDSPDKVSRFLAPLPLSHAGLLFWGMVFELGRVPWAADDPGERFLESWAGRYLRRAEKIGLPALGCVMGRYGAPKHFSHYYVAIADTEQCVPQGAALEANIRPHGQDWEKRLRYFCRIMDIPPQKPRWWLTACVLD